jgi:hypothetical protein
MGLVAAQPVSSAECPDRRHNFVLQPLKAHKLTLTLLGKPGEKLAHKGANRCVSFRGLYSGAPVDIIRQ